RLAGDEFAVLLADVDQSVAERITMDLREALAVPVELDRASVVVTATVGIALAPEHGTDISALLRSADVAMFAAKRDRVGFTVYAETGAPFRGLEQRLAVETLRQDIAARRLTLHYQPKIDLASGSLAGAEALARWRHPTLGLLAPAAFMPI